MTTKQQSHDLISDILSLELAQGALVEAFNEEHEILKKKGDYYLILDMRGQTQWSIKDNLKLIQHRIDLNMVLEAWYQKWREEEISKLNFPDDYYKEFVWERFANYYKDEIHSLLIRWQLRKDNKWLTLEDQSEDFFKFIINILGEK